MAPENAKSRGKWKGWGALGYDIAEGRQTAAADVNRQLREQLLAAPPSDRQETWLEVHKAKGES